MPLGLDPEPFQKICEMDSVSQQVRQQEWVSRWCAVATRRHPRSAKPWAFSQGRAAGDCAVCTPRAQVRELRATFAGRRVILAVDRIDRPPGGSCKEGSVLF